VQLKKKDEEDAMEGKGAAGPSSKCLVGLCWKAYPELKLMQYMFFRLTSW